MERTSLKRYADLGGGCGADDRAQGGRLLGHRLGGASLAALESVVNRIAVLAALGAIVVAARPEDEEHAYGHDLLERIEAEVRTAVQNAAVFTHLAPVEDPVSWADLGLERPGTGPDPPAPGREPTG